MKLYLFYLKKNKELYAYTINKEYKDKFLKQRNSNLFVLKKIDIEEDKERFKIFQFKNKECRLQHDFLYDGLNNIEIIMTQKESLGLDEGTQLVFSELTSLVNNIIDIPWRVEYLNSIEKITTLINKNIFGNEFVLNTFKIFYTLYKDTFYEEEE